MIGNGIIQRKLALLDDQVLKIQQHFRGMSLEQFSADWAQRSIAERAIQVAVELVIDIAERILALRNAGPAATAAEAIEKLAGIGVLPSPQPYVKMVRLRNLVVHEYESIDPVVLFDVIANHLQDFRSFRDAIDHA